MVWLAFGLAALIQRLRPFGCVLKRSKTSQLWVLNSDSVDVFNPIDMFHKKRPRRGCIKDFFLASINTAYLDHLNIINIAFSLFLTLPST